MKTVLIIDDTEDYVGILKSILLKAGYSVVVASDGREGLKEAIRAKPDLILMDLLMPEQDGVETTIKIREQESLKDVPVIFLTAVTGGEEAITSVNGKDFLMVSKMTGAEKLLKKIREYLEK